MEYEPYRVAYLRALRDGDENQARTVVEGARANGVSPTELYFEVFAPTMIRIGELWEQNELSIAEEHIATAITERLIGILSPSFSEYAQKHGPSQQRGTVLLGCVAGERHILGLRMLADLFREQNWRVLDLGPDVPIPDWIEFSRRYNVDVVAIAATAPRFVAALQMLIHELKAALPNITVMVGGAVFDHDPDLWKMIGADIYRRDPLEAIALVSGG